MSAPPHTLESRPAVYSRQGSVEPGERRTTPSRALERVEARRASLMSASTPGGSPRESSAPPGPIQRAAQRLEAPKSSPLAPSSLFRSGTSLLRSHRVAADDDDESSSIRPPSRAATEIGTLRKRSGRLSVGLTRADHAYTSQHPLPLPQSNALRRVTGGNLSSPSATTATPNSGTMLRAPASRQYYGDRLQPPLDTAEEDEKKMKRRSFGLYTGSSGTRTLSLSRVGSLSKKRASLAAGAVQ